MILNLSRLTSGSSGPGPVGALDGRAKGRARHQQRHGVQRDHRADGEHRALHGAHAAPRYSPEADHLHRPHRHREERLHHCESKRWILKHEGAAKMADLLKRSRKTKYYQVFSV